MLEYITVKSYVCLQKQSCMCVFIWKFNIEQDMDINASHIFQYHYCMYKLGYIYTTFLFVQHKSQEALKTKCGLNLHRLFDLTISCQGCREWHFLIFQVTKKYNVHDHVSIMVTVAILTYYEVTVIELQSICGKHICYTVF